MSGFEVTAAQLHAAGAQVRDVAEEVRTRLGALASRVDALCDAGWRGRAAGAFAAGWGEWRAGAAEIVDALERMGHLLGVSGHDYEAAETASVHAVTA